VCVKAFCASLPLFLTYFFFSLFFFNAQEAQGVCVKAFCASLPQFRAVSQVFLC
jgi:hypothetical protein